MANTKIEDLPLLSPEDYNSFTDYIVIQKPGGSTYKMLAGAAGLGGGGAESDRTSYVHAASVGGPYTGGFHYHNTYTQDYGGIEFQEEGLLNNSSAWVLNMKLTTTAGSYISLSGTPNPPLTSKDWTFSKPQGIGLVNSSMSTNSTQTFVFFDQAYSVTATGYGNNKRWYTNRAKLSCDLIFDESGDSIQFANIVLRHYDINNGNNTNYCWPLSINIDATIQGSLGFT